MADTVVTCASALAHVEHKKTSTGPADESGPVALSGILVSVRALAWAGGHRLSIEMG